MACLVMIQSLLLVQVQVLSRRKSIHQAGTGTCPIRQTTISILTSQGYERYPLGRVLTVTGFGAALPRQEGIAFSLTAPFFLPSESEYLPKYMPAVLFSTPLPRTSGSRLTTPGHEEETRS
ncbi:hypothetical protein K503DRAFT_771803 [Rhizopogon vinicolor AM-OR11-026]|uniref:Uncharacterized protein n=1 Tax=Rhizopogon vinicolor AM-OR11-026 TaxID=1314800 RepID=A0A1B7MWZ3_9AGAM|nr:hypothetical protein K503DRAFT_771803 [Rhizopogon vinicolor AM-OR11-026]